ncbi:hypothetical protein [Parachitinimonas caeni]|uniref:Uncharacterized protein n=1 Tax=Parachitinimonas caeni TaxID=3031301 RepID=A0ABT7DVU5_9NEIS|nr:hypothetical protein [Parachitinimonas caeni]MDK2124177.1 hypothetical protein [Parachitinimonas caeni]
MLTRRQLIKTGVLGGALLGVARFGYGPLEADPVYAVVDPARFKVLDAASRSAMAAIGRVMLAGALPEAPAARDIALQEFVHGADIAISGLPGVVQDEVKQLLMLLTNRFTRRWVVGITKPWGEASDDDIGNFLSRWRYSSLVLLRSGYQALHQVVFAAWYGNPHAWVGIGYDGPPAFVKDFFKHG